MCFNGRLSWLYIYRKVSCAVVAYLNFKPAVLVGKKKNLSISANGCPIYKTLLSIPTRPYGGSKAVVRGRRVLRL